MATEQKWTQECHHRLLGIIYLQQDKSIRSSSQTSTYVTLSCKSLVVLQEVPLEDQMALSRILPSHNFTCEETYSRLYSPTTYRPRFHGKEFFKLEYSYIFGVCGGIVEQCHVHPEYCSAHSSVIPATGKYCTIPVE